MTPVYERAAALIEFGANGLPRFLGETYDEHVDTFRVIYAGTTRLFWTLGSIAASLDRSGGGGSPRHQGARQATRIQQFCADVGIDRQTFQRLSHTYRVFATRTTTGTCVFPDLSFTHYEVAGRLSDDPIAAVTEARDNKWTANELGRRLEARKRGTPPPPSLAEVLDTLRGQIKTHVESWPEAALSRSNAAEYEKRVRLLLHSMVDGVVDEVVDDLDARGFFLDPVDDYALIHAICWIKEEMTHLPYCSRTFTETPRGRGGDLTVVPGAAGARIYQAIVGDVSHASRGCVLTAVNKLLGLTDKSRITKVGRLVLGIAQQLAEGQRCVMRLMALPPSAGGDLAGTVYERTLFHEDASKQADFDLPECLRELTAPDLSVEPIDEDEQVFA